MGTECECDLRCYLLLLNDVTTPLAALKNTHVFSHSPGIRVQAWGSGSSVSRSLTSLPSSQEQGLASHRKTANTCSPRQCLAPVAVRFGVSVFCWPSASSSPPLHASPPFHGDALDMPPASPKPAKERHSRLEGHYHLL